MKLAEILARELTEWPAMIEGGTALEQDNDKGVIEAHGCGTRNIIVLSEMCEDISDNPTVTRAQWQEAREALARNPDGAPVGATHYIPGAIIPASWWMREPGDNWYLWSEPAKQWALDTPSTGQRNLMRAIKADEGAPKSGWIGIGLPPVGMTCERMWASGPASYTAVRIIAHDDGQAVYRFLEDRRKGDVQADAQGDGDSSGNPIFRPVRTPEQIAADERLHSIRNALTRINKIVDQYNSSLDCSAAIRATVEAMIDAGYAKDKDGNQTA
jgi:hypothetical protein